MDRSRAGVGNCLRTGAFFLGLCGLFGVHGQALAQDQSSPASQELDLKSYQDTLAHLLELSKNHRQLHELRASLPEVWTVKAGDRQFHVPTQQISQALAQIENDPERTKTAQKLLQSRLHLMQHEAAELEHSSETTIPAQAETRLKDILSRREFRAATGPSASEILWTRFKRWLLEQIFKLLNALHVSQNTSNFLGWTIIAITFAILLFGAYRWLLRTGTGVEFKPQSEPVASDARQWLHDALAAAARGDYREAIHCAYWAAVARLEDLRIVPRDRTRTPRETLRLVEAQPKEHGVLRGITGSFELIWYGYRPATSSDWTNAKEHLEKIGCLQASTAPIAPS